MKKVMASAHGIILVSTKPSTVWRPYMKQHSVRSVWVWVDSHRSLDQQKQNNPFFCRWMKREDINHILIGHIQPHFTACTIYTSINYFKIEGKNPWLCLFSPLITCEGEKLPERAWSVFSASHIITNRVKAEAFLSPRWRAHIIALLFHFSGSSSAWKGEGIVLSWRHAFAINPVTNPSLCFHRSLSLSFCGLACSSSFFSYLSQEATICDITLREDAPRFL